MDRKFKAGSSNAYYQVMYVMWKKGTILLVLLALLASTGIASASAEKVDLTRKTMVDNIAAVPANSVQQAGSLNSFGAVRPMAVYDTIRQGQTKWYSKDIGSGWPGYYLDLNWGNSENSLQLRVYCADGSIIGPLYDNADGRIDGRILIYIYPLHDEYLPVGTYYHEVYGYSVSGTEDFTF